MSELRTRFLCLVNRVIVFQFAIVLPYKVVKFLNFELQLSVNLIHLLLQLLSEKH